MEAINRDKCLSRTKSTGFLDKLDNKYDFKCFSARFCGYSGSDNAHASVSSIDACFACRGPCSPTEETKLDSGIGKSLVDGDTLFMLEQKIEKLSELVQEQHDLLVYIKKNVVSSKAESTCPYTASTGCTSAVSQDNEQAMSTNETIKLENGCHSGSEIGDSNEASAARSLLNAIEIKQEIPLDRMITVALENFLQSDGVKDHVAAATAQCVRRSVHGSLCRVISAAYLPLVERSHRRLVKHVTKLLEHSFTDLEEITTVLFKSVYKTSGNIRTSLEKHQSLLEATDPINNIKVLQTALKSVLEEELRTWRGKVVQELTSQVLRDSSSESESPQCQDEEPRYTEQLPMSPMQPANPETSAIDTLMMCALINKRIQEGDVNGAFEEALSSADLSLVMAACRAAEPAGCALRPPVLLSLLQQLATDMVHDTQLKCRYLEEAILSLDKCDAATWEHLPLVVGEVRKHLTKFLVSYPKHHASRRVALIVMAADNLLKPI